MPLYLFISPDESKLLPGLQGPRAVDDSDNRFVLAGSVEEAMEQLKDEDIHNEADDDHNGWTLSEVTLLGTVMEKHITQLVPVKKLPAKKPKVK